MVNKLAPYFLICTQLMCMVGIVSAQNLAPNPSFEELENCPSFFGAGGTLLATPWVNGFGTTADVFNTCATNPIVGVPANALGWQQTNSGEGYIGAIFKDASNIWREYPQAPLVSPMVADQLYYIGMHVSLANYACSVKNIGMLISQDPPPWTLPDGIVANPQVYWENGFLTDTLNWTVIEGYYVAQGGENTVTIGNFETDASTSFGPGCPPFPSSLSYYYIDDVWITPAVPCDVLDVDLGDDVIACFEYTIDPDLGDYHYVWSTGSTDPTITVYESGVYGLTITDSCRVGSDHIQVTILGNIPVDLGPDSVMICAGETYDIQLDVENGTYEWQDGSNDPEYSIESSGIYSVSWDDGCALSADTIVVNVLDPPSPFTIGPDTLLCDDDEFEISFDENLGDFEWSDGSDESSFTIDEEGTYSLTISNACGEESAAFEVSHGDSPVVELGPDEVHICNGDVLDFELDIDAGSYFWQDSSTSNQYEISQPGLYSVTITNGCGSDYDELLVSLTPLPQVDLGPDIVACPAQLPDTLVVSGAGGSSVHWMDGSTLPQFIVTTAGSYSVTVSNVCGNTNDTVQVAVANILPDVVLPGDMIICEGDSLWLFSTGDTGSYLWQDGTTNDSLLVKNSGQFILQVSTICGVGNDTTSVQFNPDTLYPNLGPDFGLCPGNSITLFAGNTFDAYLWQDMSTADTLLISSPGMYIVNVSNGCGSGIDTVIVSGNGTPPQLNLTDSLNLCAGSQVILDAGIGGVNYLWNDGTNLSTLTINAPGTYSLTVSNSCGTDMDTVVIVDGGALPVIDLGNDIQLCQGESQIIAPDLSTADNWLWQDGSTGPTFLVNGAGLITIEVSNACGSAYDTLNATVLAAIPPLNLGNDTALCGAEMLLLEINIPDVSITWSDGSHTNQFTIAQSGIYTAEIGNACGVSTDTLNVTPLPDIPQLSLGPDQFLCPGEVITLNPGIPDVEYLWQDGSTANSYSTTQTGLITLTISNECGTATDSVLVTESTQGPLLDLGPDITACDGDTVTIQSGVAGVQYTWQDGSMNSFFKVSDDAQLTLHIANSCGEDNDTIAVHFVSPPDPDLGSDTVLCNNEKLILTSNNDAQTTTTWQDGSQGPGFIVSSAGIYSLQHSNFCGTKTDSIVVDYRSSPEPFSLGPDVDLCPGESVVLHVPITTDHILWQDGSDGDTIIADKEQVYSLILSNACGTARDEVNVDFDLDVPVVQFDSTLCPGEILILDATQPFVAQYNWSTGASNSSIDVVSPGQYAVTVMTNCYTVSEGVNVDIGADCLPVTTFFIPNVFSPNGDGVNDVFTIQFNADAEVISVEGDIFDRWGNHVFYSNQHPFTWDGTFNGKTMNPAVFVYRFTLVYSNDVNVVTEKLTGDVTLIR
jgi:gliding motility-associated-like protein